MTALLVLVVETWMAHANVQNEPPHRFVSRGATLKTPTVGLSQRLVAITYDPEEQLDPSRFGPLSSLGTPFDPPGRLCKRNPTSITEYYYVLV
jgi:hypothetical protein